MKAAFFSTFLVSALAGTGLAAPVIGPDFSFPPDVPTLEDFVKAAGGAPEKRSTWGPSSPWTLSTAPNWFGPRPFPLPGPSWGSPSPWGSPYWGSPSWGSQGSWGGAPSWGKPAASEWKIGGSPGVDLSSWGKDATKNIWQVEQAGNADASSWTNPKKQGEAVDSWKEAWKKQAKQAKQAKKEAASTKGDDASAGDNEEEEDEGDDN